MNRPVKLGAAVTAVVLALTTAPAIAGGPHDRVVSTNPADNVPIVEDGGGVWGTATVGQTTVVGGSFTSVRPRSGARVARTNIFAFNNASGAISSTFTPCRSKAVLMVEQVSPSKPLAARTATFRVASEATGPRSMLKAGERRPP